MKYPRNIGVKAKGRGQYYIKMGILSLRGVGILIHRKMLDSISKRSETII